MGDLVDAVDEHSTSRTTVGRLAKSSQIVTPSIVPETGSFVGYGTIPSWREVAAQYAGRLD